MARGNRIVVSADPKGRFTEGVCSGTPKPGTIMQVDPTVALVSGRHTYKVYQPGADGEQPVGAFYVALEDAYQGKGPTDAYASGDRIFLYAPADGDELNLLFGNAAGTADDIALGDKMIADTGTGKIVKTTGTPETEVAVALEAIVDPAADQLLWVVWTGH